MFLYQNTFTCMHAALDKLHDSTAHLMRNTAENHPKGRTGFPLTLAGMDDHKTFFICLGCHNFIACCFFLRHFFIMTAAICCGITHFLTSLISARLILEQANSYRPSLSGISFRRGCHSPRSIASEKRARMSCHASGLAF